MSVVEKLLQDVMERLDNIEKQQKAILANQQTIYGRMLITRKNMQELYNGEPPSMSQNESTELNEGAHPKLVETRKKRTSH